MISKRPRHLIAKVHHNGIIYGIKLHGINRKRVIAYYTYVDATGGYSPNLDTNVIYDETFDHSEQARAKGNGFYLNPQKLEKIFIDRYGVEHIEETVKKVAEYWERRKSNETSRYSNKSARRQV